MKIEDNESPHLIFKEQASKPSTPASGDNALYFKTDGKLYREDDTGTEAEIGAGAGSDTTAIHGDTASEIHAVAEKGTAVSADVLLIEDSEASWAKKRVPISGLPNGGGSVPPAVKVYMSETFF